MHLSANCLSTNSQKAAVVGFCYLAKDNEFQMVSSADNPFTHEIFQGLGIIRCLINMKVLILKLFWFSM